MEKDIPNKLVPEREPAAASCAINNAPLLPAKVVIYDECGDSLWAEVLAPNPQTDSPDAVPDSSATDGEP